MGNDAVEPVDKDSVATHIAAEASTKHAYHNAIVVCFTVDGGWTHWCPGECSATCGGGVRNLTRTCTSPTPSCNGSKCAGEDFMTEKCNMHCCPGELCYISGIVKGRPEQAHAYPTPRRIVINMMLKPSEQTLYSITYL